MAELKVGQRVRMRKNYAYWTAGETGTLVENTYPEKYAACVLLDRPAEMIKEGFLRGITPVRRFFVYAEEIEVMS